MPQMPRDVPQRLTEAQERKLRDLEVRILQARLRWAETVRRYGIAASARSYGISPQAMHRRITTVERTTRP